MRSRAHWIREGEKQALVAPKRDRELTGLTAVVCVAITVS